MNLEFATVIIDKAFNMTYKQFTCYNEDALLIDEDSQLDLNKVKGYFEIESEVEVIGFLDCSEGEQQDETYFAQEILNKAMTDSSLISLQVCFESENEYQQYYRYLLIEK